MLTKQLLYQLSYSGTGAHVTAVSGENPQIRRVGAALHRRGGFHNVDKLSICLADADKRVPVAGVDPDKDVVIEGATMAFEPGRQIALDVSFGQLVLAYPALQYKRYATFGQG